MTEISLVQQYLIRLHGLGCLTAIHAGKDIIIRIGDRTVIGLSRTYADGERLLALIGSSGHLEIALREGNACALLDAKIGDEVIITGRGRKR